MERGLYGCLAGLAATANGRLGSQTRIAAARTDASPPEAGPQEVEGVREAVRTAVAEQVKSVWEGLENQLRSLEVQLSAVRRCSTRERDLELMQLQLLQMEHQRKCRRMEANALKTSLEEMRSAFSEQDTEAQENVAEEQLLGEIRYEREQWLAEKRFLQDSIQRLEAEAQERQSAPAVDPEKAKLRRSVQQLEMSIESKDRYACCLQQPCHAGERLQRLRGWRRRRGERRARGDPQ
jgi:hypothetical protein